MTTFTWSDENIERMLDLHRKGKSTAFIAFELGCTRNAVIGKLHRVLVKLGLKGNFRSDAAKNSRKVNLLPEKAISPELQRNTVPLRKYTRQIPPPSLSAEGVGIILPVPKIVLQKGKMIGILDVKGCRWPVDSDPSVIGTHAFCNAETATGRSYCEAHTKEAKAPHSRDLIRQTMRQAVFILKRAGRAA